MIDIAKLEKEVREQNPDQEDLIRHAILTAKQLNNDITQEERQELLECMQNKEHKPIIYRLISKYV